MCNRIGLGTFPLAGVFNTISNTDAINLIKDFVSQGGYYIDTAPLYGFGEVEKLIAKALSGIKRDKYFIISKCGYVDVEGKNFSTVSNSGKYEDVIRTCDESLKRLKIDYIDLYMMHSPNPKTPIAETLSALSELKKDGKIKQIGVSNVNLTELEEYNKTGEIDYIQNKYSFINRSIDSNLSQYMEENRIKLIPYHVLEIGQLSDENINGQLIIDQADFRNNVKYWKPEIRKLIDIWLIQEILPILTKAGLSVQDLMMAWALQQPLIDFKIVGTTKHIRIKQNLLVNNVKISVEIQQEMEAAYQQLIIQINEKTGKSLKEFRELNDKFY